jgi:organic hydroperoxide reductase OsmC/OhrA
MSGKTDKRFLFEVRLDWLAGNKGVLCAKDATGTIHVATPPQFGGEGKPWTPEPLFLSSISSCFMTTYLAFAKKSGFEISGLDCDCIGQVEIIEGKYKFTQIDLYPRIQIDGESLRTKATSALEKTHKYCLIANSINATIFYHSEIMLVENVAGINRVSQGIGREKINSSL